MWERENVSLLGEKCKFLFRFGAFECLMESPFVASDMIIQKDKKHELHIQQDHNEIISWINARKLLENKPSHGIHFSASKKCPAVFL